jgi:hypothetical protein
MMNQNRAVGGPVLDWKHPECLPTVLLTQKLGYVYEQELLGPTMGQTGLNGSTFVGLYSEERDFQLSMPGPKARESQKQGDCQDYSTTNRKSFCSQHPKRESPLNSHPKFAQRSRDWPMYLCSGPGSHRRRGCQLCGRAQNDCGVGRAGQSGRRSWATGSGHRREGVQTGLQEP